MVLMMILAFSPGILNAQKCLPCLDFITATDALLVQDDKGRILCRKNERNPCIPASTLKVLTALAAIDHFGLSYRFKTAFYLSEDQNLKVKGFGDPLLVSEVLQKIAVTLSVTVHHFGNLLVDDAYFSDSISIPGREHSSNPYDAPPGALSANFNTINFQRSGKGEIVSAEPQTPMLPFAAKRIRRLHLQQGRYTFLHDARETTLYTGELLRHFLKERGVNTEGTVLLGKVEAMDRCIAVFQSPFTLEEVVEKMLHFSNNFIANQLMLALGADRFGPPATLQKGVKALKDFARENLGIPHVSLAEGSGISRENQISALDMIAALNRFKPYRHLLKRDDTELFKTGSLRGISTRVGFIEDHAAGPTAFVVFFNRAGSDMDGMMQCLKNCLD